MEYFDPKTRPVALFWDAEALLTAPLSLRALDGHDDLHAAALHSVVAARRIRWSTATTARRSAWPAARCPRLVAEPDDARPRIDLCAAAFLAEPGRRRRRPPRRARPGVSAAYALATALHVRYDHVGQGEATSAVTPAVMRRLGASRGAGVRRMAEALGVASGRAWLRRPQRPRPTR